MLEQKGVATGKTVLITGSTDGVGQFVGAKLAGAGAKVLVHGRNLERGNRLTREIAAGGGDAVFYQADLSSLAAVRSLAKDVMRDCAHLDILINNAGIGPGRLLFSRRELSQDGHELRFAVNYLSGFLLTKLLLPLLRASPRARIVNVTSAGQRAIDFADVMLTHGYSGVRAYYQSKLAQILFTFDLARELEGTGITATCLHPASLMNTGMVRQVGVPPVSSVRKGGDAILNLAMSPELAETTGVYYNGLTLSRANPQAYDPAARKRLRELSADLVGIHTT